ncbi:MAG: hypothetical protein RI883_312 [Bacteroidota bacterium]|jgi:hypothetical protein
MLNRFFGKKFHDYFHLFGLSLLAIGLPSTKILLSFGTIILFLNILLEGNFKEYYTKAKSNRLFLLIASFYALHVISLIWTSDFTYALNDLRIKLPLFVIPIALVVKPIQSLRELYFLLVLFVSALVITSLINFISYQNWFLIQNHDDIRSLSLFGSHIRYGILIAIGVGICLHFITSLKTIKKWMILPILSWFIYYTYFSQIISGVIALVIVLLTCFVFSAYKKSRKFGLITLISSLTLLVSPLLMLIPINQKINSINTQSLPQLTEQGNPYKHNTKITTYINGKPPLLFVCEKELRTEWKKASPIPYDSLDTKGQVISFTLVRYMASLNLRKDSVDFQKLTQTDIKNIENGIASIAETQTGLFARLDGIKFQLYHSGNPNGHSLLQRLEYWKTGINIIKKNWLFGVGTGDVQNAFNSQYINDKTKLKPQNRLRAHNSYLTSWISFGVFGIIIFIMMLWRYFSLHWKKCNFLALMFILVAASTFILEDTLETQTGVTFFAFFYGLFMTTIPQKK